MRLNKVSRFTLSVIKEEIISSLRLTNLASISVLFRTISECYVKMYPCTLHIIFFLARLLQKRCCGVPGRLTKNIHVNTKLIQLLIQPAIYIPFLHTQFDPFSLSPPISTKLNNSQALFVLSFSL